MTVAELNDQVELQGEIKFVYVLEGGYERIQVDYAQVKDCEIEYMYCDDGILYIECEDPNEVNL